jgi:hypothetical protein
MRRALLISIAVGALLLGLVGAVLANSGSINDDRGDVHGNPDGKDANYDFVKATYGHTKHGKLKHSFTVDGKLGDPYATGPTGPLPVMFIDVPHTNNAPFCDYNINYAPPHTPFNNSDDPKWIVQTCSNGPDHEKTGVAKAKRSDDRDTIRLVFPKKSIGSPSKYGWNGQFFPPEEAPAYDSIPDSGFKTHRL